MLQKYWLFTGNYGNEKALGCYGEKSSSLFYDI